MRPFISLVLLLGVAVFLSCSTKYMTGSEYQFQYKRIPYSVISGKVMSVADHMPVAARVSFPGTTLQSVECDRFGVFVATVPPGTYLVKIEAKGYFTETFPVVLDEGKSKAQEFFLRPLCSECREEFPCEHRGKTWGAVYFDPGSTYIRPEFFPVLDHAAMAIKMHEPALVEIRGFTDSVGDEFTNLSLSQKRAEAVKSYLIQRGVEPERLVAKGFGEYESGYDNRTHIGKIKNRRVELAFIDF